MPRCHGWYLLVQKDQRFDPSVLEIEFKPKVAPFFYFYNEAGEKVSVFNRVGGVLQCLPLGGLRLVRSTRSG